MGQEEIKKMIKQMEEVLINAPEGENANLQTTIDIMKEKLKERW